jgi:large subunit ribosomal protein L21
MYAIIRTGGKQYRVEPGEYLRVERFDGDLGAELDLTDVMVVGGDKTFFGEPMLKDAKVTVVVTKQQRAPKVTVFKKKRRQGYRRMQGHRQYFTEIFVKSITSPEGETSNADNEAQVYDPEKKLVILAKKQEEKALAKAAGAPKPKTKKKVAKKKTAKKKTAKKAAAKKTTAKKKTAKKKTAKKTAKKTTKKATKKS